MSNLAIQSYQSRFLCFLSWAFSVVSMVMGIQLLVVLSLFVMERYLGFEFSFMKTHGRVDWDVFKNTFYVIIFVFLALILIAEYITRKKVGYLVAVLGLTSFMMVGLPMGLNVEAMRGMLWQLTDFVVATGHLVSFSGISLAVFIAVAFLYSHTNSRQFIEGMGYAKLK